MKIRLLLLAMYIVPTLYAQEKSDYCAASLYAGYGLQGVMIRADLEISSRFLRNTSTRLYLDGGGQNISFKEDQILFSTTLYSSDCRVLTFGLGIAQEIHLGKHIRFTPYTGLRFDLVRFRDEDLIDAMSGGGGRKLQRYADTAYTIPIGPLIAADEYGDATAFEIGARLGIRLSDRVELNCSAGYARITFDSGSTLFGQYRGVAPYENPYWVIRKPFRVDGGIRFTL